MARIVIDKENEITKLENMLETLTDEKDKQSVRFAINVISGFNEVLSERPQGDLISREALKKHKFPINIANGVEIEEIEVVPVGAIDNAPTVSTEDCEGCPYCPNSNSGIPIGVE